MSTHNLTEYTVCLLHTTGTPNNIFMKVPQNYEQKCFFNMKYLHLGGKQPLTQLISLHK